MALGKSATPLQPQPHSDPPTDRPTIRSKTVPISQPRKMRPPREHMSLKSVPEKIFLPLDVRTRTHSAFLPLVPGSFSVARKSSLPVLICPEGCYYTFRACASQRGERGGGGAVSPQLGPLSFSMFTHRPCSEQPWVLRPFMPARLVMPQGSGTGQTASSHNILPEEFI